MLLGRYAHTSLITENLGSQKNVVISELKNNFPDNFLMNKILNYTVYFKTPLVVCQIMSMNVEFS